MIGDKNKPAFTLIEILVSVLIFIGIILSSTKIFGLTIQGQRNAIASQNVQENIKYFLEVISKEIRMAKKNEFKCDNIPQGRIYLIAYSGLADVLYFKNYSGECVTYSLVNDSGVSRFKIQRDSKSAFISPAEINIDSLHFILSQGSNIQSSVTINIKAHAVNQGRAKASMIAQTTLTSRYYK